MFLKHSLRPNFKEKCPPNVTSTDSSMSSNTSSKSPVSIPKSSKPKNAHTKKIHVPQKVKFGPNNQTNCTIKTNPNAVVPQKTTTKSITQAALDSGASANCFPISHTGINHKRVAPAQATSAQVADDRITALKATNELALETLPQVSKQVDKCKEISTPSLSVNEPCQGDLAVLFHGPKATVFKPSTPEVPIDGQTLMEGQLDQTTELHMVDVPNATSTPCKFRKRNKSSTKHAKTITFRSVSALINCHHPCLGAPPISSWVAAIEKGWFTSVPGLTATRVKQHCNNKTQTQKGHLKLQRQHVQSTTQKHRTTKHTVSTHEVQDLKNLLGMDATRRCPITAASGMQCMLVCIRIVPIKSMKSEHLVEACTNTHTWFKERGVEAELFRLDNEISKSMIQAIKDKGQDCQLESPSDHRTNPAERAIQDVKAHFISIRSCCDPAHPEDQWDLPISHTEFTSNPLRLSKINKNMSACSIINDHHDFMKHPISIAGTKVLVHDRPVDRGSWADRGTEGFFINKSDERHRNYKCCIPGTNGIRVSNTDEFFPTCCDVPQVEPMETIALMLNQLKELLQGSKQCDPQGGQAHALTQTLLEVQSLLGIPFQPTTGPMSTSKGGATHLTQRHKGPAARSQTRQLHPI